MYLLEYWQFAATYYGIHRQQYRSGCRGQATTATIVAVVCVRTMGQESLFPFIRHVEYRSVCRRPGVRK